MDHTTSNGNFKINELDAHARPPDFIRRAFKRFQRLDAKALEDHYLVTPTATSITPENAEGPADSRSGLIDDNGNANVGNDEDAVDRIKIIDPQALNPAQLPEQVALEGWVTLDDADADAAGHEGGGGLRKAFEAFLRDGNDSVDKSQIYSDLSTRLDEELRDRQKVPVFSHSRISGLKIIPKVLPPAVQLELLSRIFHRDLSNPLHRTNVHLHYKMMYPSVDADEQKACPAGTIAKPVLRDQNSSSSGSSYDSFFNVDPALVLSPKDERVHKAMTIQAFLDKKLRWITLGGQYNWTTKEYPAGSPPAFPGDIATLLRAVFPETEAEAAIVNLYSPGDTLSVHRDVSEECDEGLISVSIGCSGLFLISHDDDKGCEIFRLRSGDAVYMTGKSRFAWHGVPKILSRSCPPWLRDWPSDPDHKRPNFDAWSGWMEGKRINLNVRQIKLGEP